MELRRRIVSIDLDRCDGCGRCVRPCPDGALQIRNGKARLFADKYCDGCERCLASCPPTALSIIEREAEEYEEIPMGRC
jgi:ferredoxin